MSRVTPGNHPHKDEIRDHITALEELYAKNPLLREMKEYQKSRFTEDVEFELDVPSGKLVISSDLDDLFRLDPETEKRETAWRLILYSRRTIDFAKDKSAWVSIEENRPHLILQSDGTLTFDRLILPDDDFDTDEEEDDFYKAQLLEGETALPYIPSGYHMHIADYDEWVKRGGDVEKVVSGEGLRDAEAYDVAVVEIPAGKYKFTSYAVNDNFWGPSQLPQYLYDVSERICFAKMTLLESY